VREAGFSAPCPVRWSEIEAWSRLTATPLSPLEARALRGLDAVWLQAWAGAQAAVSAASGPGTPGPAPSGRGPRASPR
jgi:hypothetical protein